MQRIAALIGCLLTALAWSGCADDSDVLVAESPLFLRALIPGDGVQVDGTRPVDVSFVFNRPTSWNQVNLRLLPAPVSAGPLRSSATGRTLVWTDLALGEGVVHRVLLFGGSLRQPTSTVFFTAAEAARPKARIVGTVRADAGTLTGPLGVVVFAIPAESEFNPLQPETFREVEPLAMTAISHNGDGRDAQYALDYLPEGLEVLVVAVLDTSDDGVHDPGIDYWGYHHALAQVAPTVVVASAVDIPREVDISLLPPR